MLQTLLEAGYFPKELPPLFTTKPYVMAVLANVTALPAPFVASKPQWTSLVDHNLVRIGGLRRRLGIPNPVSYFRVARTFQQFESDLYRLWSASPYSLTSPLPPNTVGFAPSNQDRATPKAQSRVGARYVLQADVAQFYPSIYTHVVPWLMHTKAVAKAQTKNYTLAGNAIDRELQACQQGQTKGIPIGPGTSLGIAELILSSVDVNLAGSRQIMSGVRFIDDMQFTFNSLASAEHTLAKLEAELASLELSLNSTKTKILELPQTFESTYVTHLRAHIPQQIGASRAQWIDFFNRAFELARQFEADGVLRYATACVASIKIAPDRWELVQTLLWQTIASDAGSLRFVIDVLWRNTHGAGSYALNKSLATAALNALIERSAPVRHGSEIVWSIWAAILFKLNLSQASLDLIASMDDSLCACAARLAVDKGIFGSINTNTWASWIIPDCFHDSHWLFAYEAHRRNWLPTECATSKINVDPSVAFLKANGVSFLDDTADQTFVPARLQAGGGSTGGGAGYL